MSNPTISKLRIYPIKSLGHIDLSEVNIGTFSLENDRIFAMLDEDGTVINGKRDSRVNLLHTEYDLSAGSVILSKKDGAEKREFELRIDNPELNSYLSDFFDVKLKLIKNIEGQLMDTPKASSLTLISQSTLETLQKDFDKYELENIRMRFRSNIELSGVDTYWEEALYQEPGYGIRFRVGDVTMIGISPTARCSVPTQHPITGEIDKSFVKQIIASRRKDEYALAKILMYGKAPYFLAINVFVPESETGKSIRVGEALEIIAPVQLSPT